MVFANVQFAADVVQVGEVHGAENGPVSVELQLKGLLDVGQGKVVHQQVSHDDEEELLHAFKGLLQWHLVSGGQEEDRFGLNGVGEKVLSDDHFIAEEVERYEDA